MVNKMFCNNCGNQLSDNSKFCDKCGAQVAQEVVQPVAQPAPAPVAETPVAAPVAAPVAETPIAAPVAETPVAEAPVATATEFAQPQFEAPAKPPKKKMSKKKLLAWLIPTSALVVAAAVFLVLIMGPLQGWWLKNFGSAKDYRDYVQDNTKKMATGVLSETYGSALSMLSGEYPEGASEVSMKLNFGSTALDMMEDFSQQALGEKLDLDWMTSIGMTMSSNAKDGLQQMGASLNIGEAELAAIDCIMNMAEGKLYLAILSLSNQYLELDMQSVMDMYEDLMGRYTGGYEYYNSAYASKDSVALPSMNSSYASVLEMLEDPELLAILPTEEELDKLLNKYVDVILDSFDDVKKSTKTMSVGDVKQKLTVLETTIDADDILEAGKAVLKTLSKDKQIKGILEDVLGYAEDEMGLGGMVDVDEVWSMFQMAVDEALDELDDMDPDDLGIDDFKLVLTEYVNDNHEVVGRKIALNKEEIFKYIEVQKGSKIAYHLNAADMLEINGEGTRKKGATSATYTISTAVLTGEMQDLLDIELVDFSAKDGKLNGKIRLAPSADVMEELGLPSDVTSVVSMLDPKLEFGFVTTDKTQSIEINILSGNELLVGVSFSTTTTKATAITEPKKTIDINDTEALEEWAMSIDLEAFLEDLEDAGLPISEFLGAQKDSGTIY